MSETGRKKIVAHSSNFRFEAEGPQLALLKLRRGNIVVCEYSTRAGW